MGEGDVEGERDLGFRFLDLLGCTPFQLLQTSDFTSTRLRKFRTVLQYSCRYVVFLDISDIIIIISNHYLAKVDPYTRKQIM